MKKEADFDMGFEDEFEPVVTEDMQKPPKGPGDNLFLYLKSLAVFAAELGNFFLHASNYSLVNRIGDDSYLVDALGLPAWALIENLTVGTLMNSALAAAAVVVPVVGWTFLLTRQDEIFGTGGEFFKHGLVRLVTGLLLVCQVIVMSTEFSSMYQRIMLDAAFNPIPDASGDPTSTGVMILMSVSLIVLNIGAGLATAYVTTSIRNVEGK